MSPHECNMSINSNLNLNRTGRSRRRPGRNSRAQRRNDGDDRQAQQPSTVVEDKRLVKKVKTYLDPIQRERVRQLYPQWNLDFTDRSFLSQPRHMNHVVSDLDSHIVGKLFRLNEMVVFSGKRKHLTKGAKFSKRMVRAGIKAQLHGFDASDETVEQGKDVLFWHSAGYFSKNELTAYLKKASKVHVVAHVYDKLCGTINEDIKYRVRGDVLVMSSSDVSMLWVEHDHAWMEMGGDKDVAVLKRQLNPTTMLYTLVNNTSKFYKDKTYLDPTSEELYKEYLGQDLRVLDRADYRLMCGTRKHLRVPKKLLGNTMRFMFGKKNSAKVWKGLLAEARRYTRKMVEDEYYLDNPDDVPEIAMIACLTALRINAKATTKQLYRFKTMRNKLALDQYDHWLSWDNWRQAIEMPMHVNLFLLALILYQLWYLLVNIWNWAVGRTLWFSFSFMATVIICKWAGKFYSDDRNASAVKFNAVQAAIAAVTIVSGYLQILPKMLIFAGLLAAAASMGVTGNGDHGAWDQFVNSYNNGYATPGCYRPKRTQLAVFNGFEAQPDMSKYPISPEAEFEPGELVEREMMEDNPMLVLTGCGFTNRMPVIANPSQNNQYVSILTRALIDTGKAETGAWKILDTVKDILPLMRDRGRPASVNYEMKHISFDDWLARFPKGKRAMILQAQENLMEHGISPGHLAYNAFIKKEKMYLMDADGCSFDRPRLIQGISNYIKAVAGPWFYDLNVAMKKEWNSRSQHWYCSGATTDDYNGWINWALDQVDDPIFVYTDFSKMDCTENEECMRMECDRYRALGFEEDVLYGKMILKHKVKARVYLDQARFSIPGTRKSGDLDTSSGNSEITIKSLAAFFRKYNLTYVLSGLGDDSLSLINRQDLLRSFGSVENFRFALTKWYTDLGMKVKLGITDELTKAEYLSSRFYPTKDGYRIGKKPGRVLVKMAYMSYKKGLNVDDYLAMFKGTLISYLPTANHVPFVRIYCRLYLQLLEGWRMTQTNDDKWRLQGTVHDLDPLTWAAFEAVYGLNETDEQMFEQELLGFMKAGDMSARGVMTSEIVQHLINVDDEM